MSPNLQYRFDNIKLVAHGVSVVTADVKSFSDYYPFGMQLPKRHGKEGIEDYRYGFQGQEKDNEIRTGDGNSVNFEFRMYDSRIGRFFAVDPLTGKYPQLTPYQFASNSPIYLIEVEGLKYSIIKSVVQPYGEPNGKTHHLEYYLRNEDGTKGAFGGEYTVENKPTVQELNKVFSQFESNIPAPPPPKSFAQKFNDAVPEWARENGDHWWQNGNGPFEAGEVTLGITLYMGSTSQTIGISLYEGGGESTFKADLKNETVIDYTNCQVGIAPVIEFKGILRKGDDSKVHTDYGVEVSGGAYSAGFQTSTNGERSVSIGISPKLTIPIFDTGNGAKVQTVIDHTKKIK